MNLQHILTVTLLAMLVVPTGATAMHSSQEADYWHVNDRYTVELDGEGEAFMVADMTLQGVSEGERDTVTLEIRSRTATVDTVAQRAWREDRATLA